MFQCRCFFAVLLLLSEAQHVFSKEWTDKSGTYQFEATLVAFDDKMVVLKLAEKDRKNGHELISIARTDLCAEDLEYLTSKEATDLISQLDKSQNWTMRDGTKIVGRIVDFVRKDITVQRRRSKIYVNERLFSNLPEIYRKIFPKVVEEYEKIKLSEEKDLEKWVMTLKGAPKTFHCEGVIMEFENGDEYAVPFFLFAERDLQAIRPSWEQWSATKADAEEKREHSLYLQSQAVQYQQNVQNQLAAQQQMAVAQLQMLAVSTGATDLWEVYMYPGQGVMGYPINVVVTARDSSQASNQAIARNPGYVVGPVKKLSRR
jgi:hypothetical protein